MRTLLIATMVAMISTAQAAPKNTSGGAGLGFDCNEPSNPGRCSCMGPIESADCKSMEKNCDGTITCGPFVDNCTCKHKAVVRAPQAKFQTPVGGGKLLRK